MEEDLRLSCTDFIILAELQYGSLVGINDSLGTAKEKELAIIKGHKESEMGTPKQERDTGVQKVKLHIP